MGKRQTYRRRSRRRPTRKAQKKSQNMHSRRRQRGGVSDTIVTNNNVDGIAVAYKDTVVSTPTGTMDLNTFRERQQKTDDPSLD